MSSIAQVLPTPFRDILIDLKSRVPGTVGGAFVAGDGETVDWISEMDPLDWQIFAAQFGVILRSTRDAMRTFHWGDCETLALTYSSVEVLMMSLTEGYFVLLAIEPPANLVRAIGELDRASARFREEMGF